MNDTEVEERYFAFDFTLMTEEIWIIVSVVLNVFANIILLFCISKLGFRCSTYVAVFNIAILDIIHLSTCPTMYKTLSMSHELLEEFEAFSVFTNIYFCAMYGIVLYYILMALKMYSHVIESAFVYTVPAIWLLLMAAFVGGIFGFQHYYHRGFFLSVYVILFITLFIATLVDQMISTINLEREKLPEHKISIVLTLFFVTIRICTPIVYLLIGLASSDYRLSLNILVGLIQYNSIVNILILVYMDMNFKNILFNTLKLKTLIPANNVNFVNLPEETVNILENE